MIQEHPGFFRLSVVLRRPPPAVARTGPWITPPANRARALPF